MYKNELRHYPMYARDLMGYLEDILRDPFLVSQMDWDAYKMSRFDSRTGEWIRFIDDPLTANSAWRIQVRSYLPAVVPY